MPLVLEKRTGEKSLGSFFFDNNCSSLIIYNHVCWMAFENSLIILPIIVSKILNTLKSFKNNTIALLPCRS